ncbi:MAG: DUF6169 family protein [Arcicella sp.]|nr:DUF6169 family protein [Arcicella sp.]
MAQKITFKNSSTYYFPVPYSYSTYEFAIEVADNPLQGRPPLDARIPITIASIFIDFFERFTEPLVIYICDSSDSKQLARQRKFNTWFAEFKRPEFFKVEANLLDKNGNPIPSSLILKLSNPFFMQIIEEFKMIIEGYSNK